jgi:hypothetical protein
MSLSSIVDVQITRETQVPTQMGFGTPLILGESDRFTAGERIRTYTEIAQVEADFTAGDPEIQAAQEMFGQEIRPEQIKIGQVEAGDSGDHVAALNAIELVDNDWYGLFLVSRVQADIEAVAQNYIESRIKILIATSSDTALRDGTAGNVGEVLNAAALDRTSVWYSADTDNDLTAGLLGLQLPKDPGSTNWAFKTIAGPAFDDLSPTQIQNIDNVKANHYTRVAGVNITRLGTMASGEFIDVIRGSDFIQARMQELVYFELLNSEKIPYTNDGIAAIENRMREALNLGVDNQIINPDFTITTPDVADISQIDKGNRFLPDMEFEATLTGAINKVQIRGRLVL